MRQNPKAKAILFTILLLAVGFGVWTLSHNNQGSKTPDSANDTNQSKAAVDYRGFNALLDYGITTTQLSLDESSTADFIKQQVPKAAVVAVDPNTIQTPETDPASTIAVMTYTFSVDGVNYLAKLNYIGFDSAELFISDQAGTQLYDSGVL